MPSYYLKIVCQKMEINYLLATAAFPIYFLLSAYMSTWKKTVCPLEMIFYKGPDLCRDILMTGM